MMNIQTILLKNINPAEYNPRSINKDEFAGLKTSLETFGQQENLIVNKNMTLISGHQRMNAMLELNWTEAVCNVVDLDKHDEKKLNVLMNSQAISGTWDDLKLAEILDELKLDDNYESLRLNVIEPLDFSEVDYSALDSPTFEGIEEKINAMAGGSMRALLFEFKPEDWREAADITKALRQNEVYIGEIILAALRSAQ